MPPIFTRDWTLFCKQTWQIFTLETAMKIHLTGSPRHGRIVLVLVALLLLALPAAGTEAKAPAPPGVNPAYSQRAVWFIDAVLAGQYGPALQIASDRFRRDIGESGLRCFRDYTLKYGKSRFVPRSAATEEGLVIVAGVMDLPGGRKMAVHVVFKGDRVEHLHQRWAVQ